MSIDPNLFGRLPQSQGYPRHLPAMPTVNLAELPRKARRLCLEVVGFSVAGFALMVVLANSSGTLKDYRAFFLSSAKDVAVVGLAGAAAYRILRGQNEPPKKHSPRRFNLHVSLHSDPDSTVVHRRK